MPQESNLEKLTAAGCILNPDNLSEAEKQVIAELKKPEVDTLIDIRQRLGTKAVELAPKSLGDDEDPQSTLQPNIIL